jgi:hypothetical protein
VIVVLPSGGASGSGAPLLFPALRQIRDASAEKPFTRPADAETDLTESPFSGAVGDGLGK